MTWHVHPLAGCAPMPLAHYLKALGILRLIARQKDPAVRGFWQDDAFFLVTTLSRESLTRFFLNEYAPTPMLTPWNGGSGFYPKDSKAGIEAITASTLPRFSAYRDAIDVARQLLGDIEERPQKDDKAKLLKACKASWSGPALEWANAATVVTHASDIAYPAILGSGGNDGRLDFANNFMQRLVELLPTEQGQQHPALSATFLDQSLFGTPARRMASAAIGQFHPGAAGGANGSAGFDGNARINPWDFVLMLEGTMLLQVTSVRRLDGTAGLSLPQASAPFAVRTRAQGYPSAAPSDESARGEQWLPLWSRPALLGEIEALFGEGRLQAGKRRAGEALQAAQALARLGVARGITSFQRYAYAERNGQANLAVPVGRWSIGTKPRREAQLAEEIDDWISQLRRAGSQQDAFDRHARRLEGLVLSIYQQSEGNASTHIERLLEALGSAEAELVRRPRATANARLRPLPPLSEAWLELVGSGSVEFRLARAIATQRDARDRSTLRRHFAPLDGAKFRINNDALAKDSDVVWTDGDVVRDLGAVVLRRLITAEPSTLFPLAPGVPAALGDVVAFLDGSVNELRLARLTRALLALRKDVVRPRASDTAPERLTLDQLKLDVPAIYALLRVLYSPSSLERPLRDPSGQPLFPALKARSHPTPIRHLLAGRVDEAGTQAVERLRQGGARPRMTHFMGGAELARRLVASLAIPVSWIDTHRLGAVVFKPDLVGSNQERITLDLPGINIP